MLGQRSQSGNYRDQQDHPSTAKQSQEAGGNTRKKPKGKRSNEKPREAKPERVYKPECEQRKQQSAPPLSCRTRNRISRRENDTHKRTQSERQP